MELKNNSRQLSKRFPEYASQITQLLLDNNDFREIAEDYEYCINKLNRLSVNQPKNETLIPHYKNTMHELEEEIMGYFSKQQYN